MSALIPRRAGGEDPERAHSELQQRPLSQAEYRGPLGGPRGAVARA
jgi:hypothetical protein